MRRLVTGLILLTLGWCPPTVASVQLSGGPIYSAVQQQLAGLRGSSLTAAPLTQSSVRNTGMVAGNTRKSVARAALYSALLPGGGELYLGQNTKARYFIGAEVLTWVGFFSFRAYANWKEDDYLRLAAERANIDLSARDDTFRDLVGFYESIDEYNTFGRVFDPDRPYLPDTPENHWVWQSPDDRRAYRHLKNRSREADRRAEFMIGIAVINRLVSVIDAVVSARRINRRLEPSEFSRDRPPRVRLSLTPMRPDRQVTVTIFTGL